MKPSWSLPLVLLFLHLGVFCSIGQGIRVASAYYGSPNRAGVDVTRRVQQFADYGEPFRVGKDTLRIDPSPKHRKALVVIYEAERPADFRLRAGRRRLLLQERRRNSASTPEDHRAALRINQAIYGARGRYVDVTDRVRELAGGHGHSRFRPKRSASIHFPAGRNC